MSFRANLQYLRSQRSMTQEQLAMLVGVSRQAVSKWESDKAYPEMDKLLVICDLFGCTLDDLVLGDVSRPGSGQGQKGLPGAGESGGPAGDGGPQAGPERTGRPGGSSQTEQAGGDGQPVRPVDPHGHEGGEGWQEGQNQAGTTVGTGRSSRGVLSGPDGPSSGQAAQPVTASAGGEDVTGYDDFRRSDSFRVSAGVTAMLVGLALSAFFAGDGHGDGTRGALASLALMMGIAVGLAFLIPAGMRRHDFRRRHPFVAEFHTDEERARAYEARSWGLVCGIGTILVDLGIVACGRGIWRWPDGTVGMVFLLLLAAGVFMIQYPSMNLHLIDVDNYNRDREREEEAHDSHVSQGLINAIEGAVMSAVTLVALIMLFTGHENDLFGFDIPFWSLWVIGGIFCGLLGAISRVFTSLRK
ncbi:helix-turn-helix domain-containing protein [Bifidobacterium favimelis]|uniref:helix-turn-helix domain-containing protein n=1 Tax=Bifidobacterium favimelis TaxID=3122979 RepID=UPI00384E21DC